MTLTTNPGPADVRPVPALADLIAPVTVQEFTDRYWEQEALVLRRGDPDRYRELLTLARLDDLLSTMSLRANDIRVVQEGRSVPIEELSSDRSGGPANVLEAVLARYRAGATVNLVFLHERYRPLQDLCRKLSLELSARVQTNLYLTPAGRHQGLKPHHDTHDVIVLQIHGTKHWALYPSPDTLPLQRLHPAARPEEPIQEFDLSPGDLLYLPRGHVHAATSTTQASCHLTIGFKPVLWGALVQDAVAEIVAAEARFRTGLPPGFATDPALQAQAAAQAEDLLDALRARLDGQELVERARRRAWLGRQPDLRGHLLDLEGLAGLDLDTAFRRRPGLLWRLDRDEVGRTRLEFHGKQVLLPDHVMDEVVLVSDGGRLTGRQIPGDLDDEGRLVLIRRLVTEGFLELDGTADDPDRTGSDDHPEWPDR